VECRPDPYGEFLWGILDLTLMGNSVMTGIYSPTEFFHVGRKGKNNISPNDAKAKLKLKDPNAKTTIYVKLWRKKPVNANAPEDFSYVIDVAPRG